MTKRQFLELLGRAYDFPDYYAHNLDSADEILASQQEADDAQPRSLQPLFDALLAEATPTERAQVWKLLQDHFGLHGE